MDIDVDALTDAVESFKRASSPGSTTLGAPATVDDVRRVIDGVAGLAETFICELSQF